MPASSVVTASSSANSLDANRSGSENSGTAISQRTSVMRANSTGSRMTSSRSSAVGGRPSASQRRMRSNRGWALR